MILTVMMSMFETARLCLDEVAAAMNGGDVGQRVSDNNAGIIVRLWKRQ
jgi:hypothetical protein